MRHQSSFPRSEWRIPRFNCEGNTNEKISNSICRSSLARTVCIELCFAVARRNRNGRVVFTKGGFIVGVGGGEGVLTSEAVITDSRSQA